MPAKTSKPTDPWAAMDAVMKQDAEPVGDGWFSTQEFADRYKISYRNSYNRLEAMYRAGQVERWRGRRIGQSGGQFSKYRSKAV